MTSPKKKYVVVGSSGRSHMFTRAIAEQFKDQAELLALCDTNRQRMTFSNKLFEEWGGYPVKHYIADDFDKMIKEQKPDVVIVVTKDCVHHKYIIRAMELGCDVITEKPMTMDAVKCQAVIDAAKKTGKKLTVTFNYRYAPARSKLRRLIKDGAIGDVISVDFHWYLDTRHGADYFRRWHRNKENAGGLMVHKATHHFDLVNWWIDSEPVKVYATGGLEFYGDPSHNDGMVSERCHGCQHSQNCKFHLDISQGNLKGMYLDAEGEDGYLRDRCVFSKGIDIEDTMNVAVDYKNGVRMSYSLNAFMPYEGYKIAFNGTKGRLELDCLEASFINSEDGYAERGGSSNYEKMMLFRSFKSGEEIEIPKGVGGHGGGDVPLLNDVFLGASADDDLHHAAGMRDGAMSILTGIAANESMKTGLPVDVTKLVKF
ncbi:MAG: Gfo/Idh/MocA family oxidoreductase [Planctomycetota bacterium]